MSWSGIRIFLLSVLLAGVCLSCKKIEPLTFESITAVRVLELKKESADLMVITRFHNPNPFGGKVTRVNIKVEVAGKPSARVTEFDKVKVPANTDFEVPLRVMLSFQDQNLLQNLIDLFSDKKFTLHFSGSITAKMGGIPRVVPVDYSEEISLK